jgi:hypothetical protein
MGEGWATFGIDQASFAYGVRDQMVVQRFDRSGAYLGEVAHVEGFLRQLLPDGGGGPNPLSPRARFRVQGGEVYVAETLDPSIRVYRVGADSARVIRWDPGTLPSVDAAMRAAVDAGVAAAPADKGESQRRRLESFPLPDRVSAFWDFLVDDLGFLWVRPFDPAQHSFNGNGAQTPFGGSGQGGDWVVLSPDGVVLDTIALPVDLGEPMQITRDAVVGIATDELGVQYVRVYALERR